MNIDDASSITSVKLNGVELASTAYRAQPARSSVEPVYFYRVLQMEEYPKFNSRHYALSVHGMEDPDAHIVALIKHEGDAPFELEDRGQRLTVVTFEDMSMDDTGEYQCSVELPH